MLGRGMRLREDPFGRTRTRDKALMPYNFFSAGIYDRPGAASGFAQRVGRATLTSFRQPDRCILVNLQTLSGKELSQTEPCLLADNQVVRSF